MLSKRKGYNPTTALTGNTDWYTYNPCLPLHWVQTLTSNLLENENIFKLTVSYPQLFW